MANPQTTLQTLINNVRFRTNMEQNQFVTDAELTYFINSATGELDDILVSRYEDYRVTTATASITNGTDPNNYINVPTDFYKLRGVERQVDGIAQKFMTLKRFSMQERNRDAFPIMRYMYGRLHLFYRVEGQKIFIIPADTSVATYRIWYVPQLTLLVNPSDTLQPYMDVQNWHEYITTDASIKVLLKQDLIDTAQSFMMQKEALKTRIEALAANRDAGCPKKVVSTRFWDEWGDGTGFYSY